MAHSDAREGKWRGNWRMNWVASTLTLPRNVVYPALLPLIRTPRLPVVDWTDAPSDLNGLFRFAERRNLVSARVPSRGGRGGPVALTPTVIQQECSASNLPPFAQSLEQRKEIPWVDAFHIWEIRITCSLPASCTIVSPFCSHRFGGDDIYFGLVYVSHSGLNVYVTPAVVCKKGINQPLHGTSLHDL
jgi:hypothetical protein